jgi:phasin family protein
MMMTAKRTPTPAATPAKAKRTSRRISPAAEAVTAVSVPDAVVSAAEPAPPAPVPPQATPVTAAPATPAPEPKEPIMATAFETTTEAARNAATTMNAQTESVINSGKAAMEQVAAKSKEAVEASMKSLDDMNDMARANVDALIASARAATAGVEQVVAHLTEVSKKTFEESSAMMKSLAAAKTPNDLMQLQTAYAKAQFDTAVSEYSKLTEMMVKLAGEVMEPVQIQIALASDKMKSAWNK